MINKIGLGIILALVIIVVGLGTSYHIQKVQNVALKEQLQALEQQHDTIKHFITQQNESIQEANKQLVQYQAKIEVIEKEAEIRTKQLAEEVKKIATCEDGFNVLKKVLERAKTDERNN